MHPVLRESIQNSTRIQRGELEGLACVTGKKCQQTAGAVARREEREEDEGVRVFFSSSA